MDEIIRESKATSRNMIEMFLYCTTTSFIRITCSLLMLWDTTYFSSIHLTFMNYSSTVLISVFMALSAPSQHSNRFVPDTNFMGGMNHLRFWTNVIIPSAGLIAAYFYFVQHPDFVPNGTPEAIDEFHTDNMSATIVFLMILLPGGFNGLILYRSSPWKQPICYNVILFIVIMGNIVSFMALFFFTAETTETLGTVPIPTGLAAVCLAIMISATIVQVIINKIIDLVENV